MEPKRDTSPHTSKTFNKTNPCKNKHVIASSSGNEHEHIIERFDAEISDNLFGDLSDDADSCVTHLLELLKNAKEDYPCLSVLSQYEDLTELIRASTLLQLLNVQKEVELAGIKGKARAMELAGKKWEAREMDVKACIRYLLAKKCSTLLENQKLVR